MSLGLNWEYYDPSMYGYTQGNTQSYTPKTNNAMTAGVSTMEIQDAGLFKNKCTDGLDDGEIGTISKILNTAEGVLGMGVNMVKNAIKHPFKTAAMIGVCCIPYAGPALAMCMAGYGIYNGVKTIQYANEVAENATTDAQAKAAYENIGSGAATVGLSALALKGSAGMLKGQVKAGVSQWKGYDSSMSTAQKVGQFAKDTATQAGQNIGTVASSIWNKATKVGKFVKEGYQAAKNGNFGEFASTKWNSAVETASTKIGETAQKTYEKASNKIDDLKTNNKNLTRLKKGAGKNPNIIKDGGQYYEINADGSVTQYNRFGKEIGTTHQIQNGNIKGATTTYKNGAKSVETTTRNPNGTKKVETVTTKKDGTQITETKIYNSDGKLAHSKTQTVSPKDVRYNKTTSSNGNASQKSAENLNTGNGYQKNGKGTTWEYNGNTVNKPTFTQKAKILYDTSKTVQKINGVLDYQLPGLGANTNPFLMGAGALEWLEEMEK